MRTWLKSQLGALPPALDFTHDHLPAFPLEGFSMPTKLGKELMDELRSSYNQHQIEMLVPFDSLRDGIGVDFFRDLHTRVVVAQQTVEKSILHTLRFCPVSSVLGMKFELARLSNLVSIPVLCDVLALFGKGEERFATGLAAWPLLLSHARALVLREQVRVYLVYHKYLAKLVRLQGLVTQQLGSSALVKELATRHMEGSNYHPCWLLLEVEQGFMIRARQVW